MNSSSRFPHFLRHLTTTCGRGHVRLGGTVCTKCEPSIHTNATDIRPHGDSRFGNMELDQTRSGMRG